MLTPTHTAPRRKAPFLVIAGVATVAMAATGAVLTVSPARALAPAAQPVAASILVGNDPDGIAVATYANRAYVATDDSVAVVDTRSHQLVTAVPTGLEDQTAISLVRSGAAVYVGSFADRSLAVLDTGTQTVTDRIAVGPGTTDIATVVTPRTEYAYVSQITPTRSRVTVVNTDTGKIAGRIHVAGGPQAVAVTPDQSRVWVGTSQSGSIKVVNPRTQRVVGTVATTRGGPVADIAFNASGTRAFVSGAGGVTAVRVKTGKKLWFVTAPRVFRGPTPINVGPIALGPNRTLLVVNSTFPDDPQQGSVSVLSRSTHRLVTSIRTGSEPTALGIDRVHHQAFTTDYADGSVSYFPLSAAQR